METVLQAAFKNNVMLEINSTPNRLDLKDTHAFRARELGIKLAISTDSHRKEQLAFMRYGVGVARRGWCRADDILNTGSFEQVNASLKKKR